MASGEHEETHIRRTVTGRYLVRVEAMTAQGEAVGRVISVISEPDADALAQVFAGRTPTTNPPESISFIGGLPDELVEVEVTWTLPRPGRKRAKHAPPPSTHALTIVEPSADRISPHCNVFGICGGCQLQHLDYSRQLEWKASRVMEALEAAGVEHPPVLAAIGMDEPWHYRNHMRFSVDREGRVGLTARGSRRVLPLLECPIADPVANTALELLGQAPRPRPQAMVRVGTCSRQILLQPKADEDVRKALEARQITVREDGLEECLLDIPFKVRPSSFFQTNTQQANRMASLVLERLPKGEHVTLVDAYCGVGTFAKLMARQAGRVIAIEESASAVRDARQNLDDEANVDVLQGKVEDLLPAMTEVPGALVIDPPRAGVQRPVLDALVQRRIPRVVYVSCDPDTLARDLAYLTHRTGAYELREVQPLDMFPQTAHIENIATLEAIQR